MLNQVVTVFGVPGRGDHRLQPVFVEDLAELAVEAGSRDEDRVVDAVGPEVYTFEELVRSMARIVGSDARIVRVPPTAALLLCKALGYMVRDVVLTREEIAGLMAGLLVSHGPPTGRARLSAWLRAHARTVGSRYRSELRRHYR